LEVSVSIVMIAAFLNLSPLCTGEVASVASG
jgi:hypothetical protein